MASKRQLAVRVKTLEDDMAFERAKVASSLLIINKLRTGGDAATVSRMTSYWMGYWEGRADHIKGVMPDATQAKNA